MAKYKISSDEIWEVHGSTWVVKHKALERVAAEVGVIWDRPAMIETSAERNTAVICVFGKLGERTEWSIGEAAPSNYKVSGKMSAYPYAMAEKRGKDRVILKLLNANASLYSEAEADEFEERAAPEDDGIPRSPGVQVLTVDAQRPIFSELEREMLKCATVEELKRWKLMAKDRASRLSDSWRKVLSDRYLEHLRSLEKSEADEYIERKTG